MKESLNEIMNDLGDLDKSINELIFQCFVLVTKFFIY